MRVNQKAASVVDTKLVRCKGCRKRMKVSTELLEMIASVQQVPMHTCSGCAEIGQSIVDNDFPIGHPDRNEAENIVWLANVEEKDKLEQLRFMIAFEANIEQSLGSNNDQ